MGRFNQLIALASRADRLGVALTRLGLVVALLSSGARFDALLSAVGVCFALMIASHRWLPRLAVLGSFLVFVLSCVGLSLRVTAPESWSPESGRLVLKDAVLMGAALVIMADSARSYFRRLAAQAAAAARGTWAHPAPAEPVGV